MAVQSRKHGVHRGFQLVKRGKVIPRRGAKDRKGMGTNSGKSDLRNLEAESIKQSGKYQESTYRTLMNVPFIIFRFTITINNNINDAKLQVLSVL